ncbi:2800_t:CDS:2, partial [Acaulospora colombiana]
DVTTQRKGSCLSNSLLKEKALLMHCTDRLLAWSSKFATDRILLDHIIDN